MRTVFLVPFLVLFFFSSSYGIEVSPGVVFDQWTMTINRDGIRLVHDGLRDIFAVALDDGSSATVIDFGCDGTFDIVMVNGRPVFRESPQYRNIWEKVFLWFHKVDYQKNVEAWKKWKEENKKGGLKN